MGVGREQKQQGFDGRSQKLHWFAVHAVAAGNADAKMVRGKGLKLGPRDFGLLVRVTERKLEKTN